MQMAAVTSAEDAALTPPLRGANIGFADIISQRERGKILPLPLGEGWGEG
jgi:hypothetical protein